MSERGRIQRLQSSTRSPGTRTMWPRFAVTSVASRASACADDEAGPRACARSAPEMATPREVHVFGAAGAACGDAASTAHGVRGWRCARFRSGRGAIARLGPAGHQQPSSSRLVARNAAWSPCDAGRISLRLPRRIRRGRQPRAQRRRKSDFNQDCAQDPRATRMGLPPPGPPTRGPLSVWMRRGVTGYTINQHCPAPIAPTS